MGEYSSYARAQRAAGGCEAAPRGIKLAPGATHWAAAPVIGREGTAWAVNKSGTAKGNAFRLLLGRKADFWIRG